MGNADAKHLRTKLAAAYELLGGDHSTMPDHDAETAHRLVSSCLEHLDEILTESEALKAVRQ